MMFHGMGATDPYAGTDALGGPTNATTASTPDADCTPGTAGCVPHWYCYIPFMATPDCLASFQEGTKELASAGATAATGTVVAAVGGAASGVSEGVAAGINKGFADSVVGGGLGLSSGLLLAVGGGLLAFMFLTSRR